MIPHWEEEEEEQLSRIIDLAKKIFARSKKEKLLMPTSLRTPGIGDETDEDIRRYVISVLSKDEANLADEELIEFISVEEDL